MRDREARKKATSDAFSVLESSLGAHAKLLYIALCSALPETLQGQVPYKEIAELTSIRSRTTLRKIQAELVQVGLLTVEVRDGDKQGNLFLLKRIERPQH